MKRKLAFLLSGIFLILILGSVAWIVWMNGKTAAGSYAEIIQDGTIIETLYFSQLKEPVRIRVEGKDGAYNVIEAGPDGIFVAEASCPDKLCEKAGKIRSAFLPIICLPNHLVIRVYDGTEAESLDDIAY